MEIIGMEHIIIIELFSTCIDILIIYITIPLSFIPFLF